MQASVLVFSRVSLSILGRMDIMLQTLKKPEPVCAWLRVTAGTQTVWEILVSVTDSRTVYGRIDYLVQPHADGTHGAKVWVSEDRVTDLESS